MYSYSSKFSDRIHSLLDFRKSLGLSIVTYEYNLSLFDKFCCNKYPEETMLTSQVVNDWLEDEADCGRGGLRDKYIDIRYFGRYLSSLGEEAYIIPIKFTPKQQPYSPYILSDSELSDFFHTVDAFFADASYPLKQHVFSVMFRLIYTCGLRPGEGIRLMKSDVNLMTGEIILRKTKQYKERIIVVSDDMLSLLKEYCFLLETYSPDCECLFPDESGNLYKAGTVSSYFRKCWMACVGVNDIHNCPRFRIYDLRHRFATTVLQKWLDEGKDIYSVIPYLRVYMGHAKLEETLYYVHLLPENLLQSEKIDWGKLNSMIPEAHYE
ncbi:MAG: tyrosine-type recombinase/integrase [Eubacterium sp.]|jgi:integrase/recombinase XerD|nr:tyrosine-type recombinase/integrase [Eubacterium sp.]